MSDPALIIVPNCRAMRRVSLACDEALRRRGQRTRQWQTAKLRANQQSAIRNPQ